MSQDERTLTDSDIQTVVDITPQKKNVIMDSQILTTLMGCPCLADFRFNMNLQSINGNSNSLECGLTVHKFVETYYGAIIKGVDKDKAAQFGLAAAELFIKGCPHCTGWIGPDKPICGHKPNEYPGIKNTPDESESYKTGWKFVLQTCEEYAKFYRNEHWVPLEVEIVKGKVLYEDDEMRVMWKSKFDLITDTNQGIYPVDHKTMKQRRDTNSMNNQFIGQCILAGTNAVVINKIGFQKSLKPEEKFMRAIIPYSNNRLIEWQSHTLPYYARMMVTYAEMGFWPRNFTNCEGKYGNCAFYETVCGLDPDLREDGLKQNFIVGPKWNPTNDEE